MASVVSHASVSKLVVVIASVALPARKAALTFSRPILRDTTMGSVFGGAKAMLNALAVLVALTSCLW